jgi:tetratricopeptide (TPR) repeat protein
MQDFDALWAYNDPAGTERRFRELLVSGAAADPAYRLQLLTQIGRALGLQQKYTEAHALLDLVEQEMSGGDLVEVRYLLERGRVYNSAGQSPTALPLFQRAYELAQVIGADFYAVDALHMLAIAAPSAERLSWNTRAIAYANDSQQERARSWLGSLYNNSGWTLFDEGRHAEALEMFRAALAFREAQGNPEAIKIARWSVAKTLRLLGQVEEALATQRELADPTAPDGFVHEEIAESLLALGRADEAKAHFALAYERLVQVAWLSHGSQEDRDRLERLRMLGQATEP